VSSNTHDGTPEVPYHPGSPWPCMRGGPRNDGRSPLVTGRGGFERAEPMVLRRWSTGNAVFSTPVVGADETLYVGSADRVFYAFDPKGGEQRWSFATGECIDSAGCIARDGTIYFPSCDGRLYGLSTTGEQTWVLDRPRLDARLLVGHDDCPAEDPIPGYVDSDLSYREGWHPQSYYVFTTRQWAGSEVEAKLRRAGATVLACDSAGDHVDPLSLLHEAHRHGVHTAMVEGGPKLAAAFLARGVVDRWIHYIAPVLVGRGGQWPPEFPVVPSGSVITAPSTAMAAADDEAAGNEFPSASGVAGAVRLPITFHLTACDPVGRDVRLVYDRLSFQDTLANLARYPNRNGAKQESG